MFILEKRRGRNNMQEEPAGNAAEEAIPENAETRTKTTIV
jgi:hypothetical protein